jgi:hypothetical protein
MEKLRRLNGYQGVKITKREQNSEMYDECDSSEAEDIENGVDLEDTGDECDSDLEDGDVQDQLLYETTTHEVWKIFKTEYSQDISYVSIPGVNTHVIKDVESVYQWEIIMYEKQQRRNEYARWDDEIKIRMEQIRKLIEIKSSVHDISGGDADSYLEQLEYCGYKLKKNNEQEINKKLSLMEVALKKATQDRRRLGGDAKPHKRIKKYHEEE